MSQLQHPVIVVPGITGTRLRDTYPLEPEVVWAALRNNHDRVAVHPDSGGPGQRHYESEEARRPARVETDGTFRLIYDDLIAELRHNLSMRADAPVPVFAFAYDWRQPLSLLEDQLGEFIEEVIERTALLRHYREAGHTNRTLRVDLVCHSMGGLIAAGLVARKKRAARIRKVATLGTPYRGAFEAVTKLTRGDSRLSGRPESSREREAARVTPSLYHLLPDLPHRIDTRIHHRDLFRVDNWQKSTLDTLAEYFRLHGSEPRYATDSRLRNTRARALLQRFLEDARSQRDRVDDLVLGDQVGLGVSDWLCIVGVNEKTMCRMGMRRATGSSGHTHFDLQGPLSDGRDTYQNRWNDSDPTERVLTGDGSVPYESAIPHFLEPRHVVCLTRKDIGWDLLDLLGRQALGLHAILPRIGHAQRLVVRFLQEAEDRFGNTTGRRAPGVDAAAWAPPFVGGLEEA